MLGRRSLATAKRSTSEQQDRWDLLSVTDRINAIKESLTQKLKLQLTSAEAFVARHPRALTGTVVTLLTGFAVTAFGIAPLAPDANELPQTLVEQSIPHLDLDAQLSALAEHQIGLSRNELTRSSDTADSLLKRMGAFDPAAAQFLRNDPTARRLLQGRAGKMVQVTADASGSVEVHEAGPSFTLLGVPTLRLSPPYLFAWPPCGTGPPPQSSRPS